MLGVGVNANVAVCVIVGVGTIISVGKVEVADMLKVDDGVQAIKQTANKKLIMLGLKILFIDNLLSFRKYAE